MPTFELSEDEVPVVKTLPAGVAVRCLPCEASRTLSALLSADPFPTLTLASLVVALHGL